MKMMQQTFWISMKVIFFLFRPAQTLPTPLEPRDQLICSPATWQTIVAFYLLNYGTHAMTVKGVPGDTLFKSVGRIVSALLLPFSGVWRGCSSIASGRLRGETDLQHAARAGALCMLTRNENWRPNPGEKIKGCRPVGMTSQEAGKRMSAPLQIDHRYSLIDSPEVDVTSTAFHGEIGPLPKGYCFRKVPPSIVVTSRHGNLRTDLTLSYSTVKAIAAIIQVGFAVVTLYQTRGNQIQRFGYAAFGLTVIPYAIMSIVNLLGNAMTPDYSSMYMIWSEVMAEAEARGGKFDGMVGIIEPDRDDQYYSHELEFAEPDKEAVVQDLEKPDIKIESRTAIQAEVTFLDSGNIQLQTDRDVMYHHWWHRPFAYALYTPITKPTIAVSDVGRHTQRPIPKGTVCRTVFGICIGTLSIITPYVLIFALTQFKPADSTAVQRGFTMAWLVVGQVYGLGLGLWYDYVMTDLSGPDDRAGWVGVVAWLAFASAPAIGGLVMVGQMLKLDGSCTLA
jgi:hypothetical protein